MEPYVFETLTVVQGFLIPLLVGVVSKKVASSGLKGLLNALLSAAAGVITVMVQNSGAFDVGLIVNVGIQTFIVSIAAYYGLLKPTGIAGKVQDKTAGVGVSDRSEDPDEDVI